MNLQKLFELQGFKTECTFVVKQDGHLIHDAEASGKGGQVGIIVQVPKEKAIASKAQKGSTAVPKGKIEPIDLKPKADPVASKKAKKGSAAATEPKATSIAPKAKKKGKLSST